MSLDSSSALKVLQAKCVHGCLATLNYNSDYHLNNCTCHNSKKGIRIIEIPSTYSIAQIYHLELLDLNKNLCLIPRDIYLSYV